MARRSRKTTSHKPGPTSRPDRLVRLDGRTREGKIINAVMAALVSDLGGEDAITAAERLLVRSASIKYLRVELLAEKLLEGEEAGTDGHSLVSWANSLRLDLCALGLRRRAKEVPTGTAHKVAAHFSVPFQEAAE